MFVVRTQINNNVDLDRNGEAMSAIMDLVCITPVHGRVERDRSVLFLIISSH